MRKERPTNTFRIRTSCKGVTDGITQGTALRMGETMGEVTAATQTVTNQERREFADLTLAKVRMFEDGSGLFSFKRGNETLTLRWSDEQAGPLTVKAFFGDVEAELVPTQQGAA